MISPGNKVLLEPEQSSSGLGISQTWVTGRVMLRAWTPCCKGKTICWATNSLLGVEYWACSNCLGQIVFGEGKTPPPVSSPVFELEDEDAVHKWTYAYLEEIQTWVAQWTGLDPKTFDLNFT